MLLFVGHIASCTITSDYLLFIKHLSGKMIVPPLISAGEFDLQNAEVTLAWYEKVIPEHKLQSLHVWRYLYLDQPGHIQEAAKYYQSIVDHLRSSDLITSSDIGTHQGRWALIPAQDSTNDCCVISPLVIAANNRPLDNELSVTIDQIRDIMDGTGDDRDRTAPVLSRAIRSRIEGASPDDKRFLPPYDVTMYLITGIDHPVLNQHDQKFSGGGNIFKDQRTELLKALDTGDENAGACEYNLCYPDVPLSKSHHCTYFTQGCYLMSIR